MTSPSQHWTQEQAATAMRRSRRTIRSWCRPMPWRPALLAPDPVASEREGRPLYRVSDVINAEWQCSAGRARIRPAMTR